MSFPQTTSVNAIRGGLEIWRLFTEIESSGDIYEADTSARALVIGPDSDVGRVMVTYFDEQAPASANSATLSVTKPWVGRLDAFPARNYASGDAARLLFSLPDLMPPPFFTPSGAEPFELIQPTLDLLFYIAEEPGFIAPRSDKVFLFEQLQAIAFASWYLVPFYGRRSAKFTFKSLGLAAQPAVTVNIYGFNFSNLLGTVLADDGHQRVLIGTVPLAAPALGAGVTGTFDVTDRFYDYLGIQIVPAAPFPSFNSFTTNIAVSDVV